MYLLGYDVGSSSVKAAIVDAQSGRCVATDFYPKNEAPIKALHSGWAEQRPSDWWEYLKKSTASVLAQSRIAPSDIGAIGISYQMHGLVAVDRQLNPVRDAIIWCDSRAVDYGNKAFAEIGPDVCLGRLLNSPGNFTASKLKWLKENEPAVFERIYKVMLPGDYIAMRLTGRVVTNPEGLSEYVLWDFAENSQARFLMDYYGFSADLLPELGKSFGEQGVVTPQAASELGLSAGIPVTYRAGDQPNNALSLNVFEPGEVASTAGTSGVVYGIIDRVAYDAKSRVNNFAHVNHSISAPRIGVMTCINGTGILNSWCRRNVCSPDTSYSDMNAMAEKAPIGCEGLSVLPFGNGSERVLENADLGCSLHGLNFNIHGRDHLLRAAQEGIVFSFIYGMEIMRAMGMEIRNIHAGNANMFMSRVFRQTLASTSGAVIELYDTDGAVGAARGAGIGAGIYNSPSEAFASLRKISEIFPENDVQPYMDAYQRWKTILEKSL